MPGSLLIDQLVAEFLAQVVGVNPQVMGLAVALRAPDFAQQLALGDDFSGMAGQREQERIFRGGHLQRLAG